MSLIKSRLRDSKNEIKQMSKDEIKDERTNMIVDLIEKILKFNNQNQSGQGLKISTTYQMLSRLRIFFSPIKRRNNSKILKNEIKKLLYFLHRSKKLSKTIYKHLVCIF